MPSSIGKQEALRELKGTSTTADSDSGLKGAGSADSDLKDAPNDSMELKTLSEAERGSSAAKSGKDAVAAGSLEEAKDLSNCQFDKAGCRKPDAIRISRRAVQQNSKPVPEALMKRFLGTKSCRRRRRTWAESTRSWIPS